MPLSLNYKFLLITSFYSSTCVYSLNLVISRLLWNRLVEIPLWGQEGIASYLTSASMISSFAITIIVTQLARRSIRNNKLMPLQWHLKSQTIIDQLPAPSIHRAFILGVTGSLMAGLTVFLLHVKGFAWLNFSQFTEFSLMYFVLLSTAIALMAAYRAMGDKVINQSNTLKTESTPLL